MIVVDTSALFAIVLAEDDGRRFYDAIADAGRAMIGAPTLFELQVVVSKRAGRPALALVDRLVAELKVDVVPWAGTHVPVATDALLRFGGRPARLNLGDCMAYAIARSFNAPLLFKGDDFRHTDVRSVL